MAKPIQFFTFIRKTFEVIGIHPNGFNQTCSYNWRNSTILLFMSIMFGASTAFFLFQARTFHEYGDTFLISAALLLNIVCLLTMVPKMTDVFELMEIFGEFVEKRECNKR